MGFSDVGGYGCEIKTPNLDRLASGSLRFTQFYNTARCRPSRASYLLVAMRRRCVGKHFCSNRKGNRAIRIGDWKLAAEQATPWELHDVSKDRLEIHELASQDPPKAQKKRNQEALE